MGAPSLRLLQGWGFWNAQSSRLQGSILQRDRLAGRLRASSRQRGAERAHRIVNRDGWHTIVAEIVYEVLKLGRVGVAETLHEEWHGVVRNLILRHHEQRRLAEVADSQSALCAEVFPTDVIPVDAAAAEIDDADAARSDTERGAAI